MRSITLVTFFLLITTLSFAQQKNAEAPKKFKFFNRTGLSYTFGLNETFPNQKINALHIKTVVGLAMPLVGFGIGLENGSFKSSTGSGANFNTLAFTGNLHVLAKPIETKELNYFVKGAAGYAVSISRYYDKGLTYEGAVGGILTTKKGGRYFLQAIYNYQSFDNFSNASGKIYVQSVGLGVGTWF
jgi:hypothetical protein